MVTRACFQILPHSSGNWIVATRRLSVSDWTDATRSSDTGICRSEEDRRAQLSQNAGNMRKIWS